MKSAVLNAAPLHEGDSITAVGMNGEGELRSRTTQVSAVEPLDLPLSRSMQFRDSNLEVAQLLNAPNEFDGVLVDRNGTVQALWSSFPVEGPRAGSQVNRGVPVEVVTEMLERFKRDAPLHTLDVELNPRSLADVGRLGLPEAWLRKIEAKNPEARKVLSVARITGGAESGKALRQGDLILAIDAEPVAVFRDVERAVVDRAQVAVTVWRGKAEMTVNVPTTALTGADLDRVVQWAGATLHAPHRAMSVQRGVVPQGVYVAFFVYGSPATRYRLVPGRRIVEVDGQPTPDLDAFLKVVAGRPDRSSLRLRTLSWNNVPEVITLKLDRHYWPTSEIVRTATGWERRSLE